MPTTTLTKTSKPGSALKKNAAGRIVIETDHEHHAGSGACKKCDCKKFVYRRLKSQTITSHQFIACDECGHAEKDHA